MNRVFVTGATGFLGRHLVAQLLEGGHEVVAMIRTPPPPHQPLPEGIQTPIGDVLDAASVRAAAEGCTEAFHAAGLVSRQEEDAEAMYRVHVDGTKTTLTALKEAGVKRVVVASTSGTVAVSDDPDAVAREDAEPPMGIVARWPYYRSKVFAERVALERNEDGFEVISVNPSLLLGPGDLKGSSTEDVERFLGGRVPVCPGGGMAFVDVRDAAAGMIAAMERGEPGARYLLNGANLTLEALFGRLERISGVKAPPVRLPRTSATLAGAGAKLVERATRRFNLPNPLDRISAEMAQYFWYCDSSKAEHELGWTARDPSDTLADTVRDLEERGVVWLRD